MDLSGSAKDINSKGQRLITPCLPLAPGRRSVVAIMRPMYWGMDYGGFRFSQALALTTGSTTRLLRR